MSMSDQQPAAEEQPVLYEVEDNVAVITLNRPHRRNAITGKMLQQLGDAFLKADTDVAVRCVVLTGAGQGFCSGLDMKEAAAGTDIGGNPNASGALPHTRTLPTNVLFNMDTPVIAAVNGAAAGYGLDLALGCDMRIGGESTKLLPGFAKRGIVPESGGTWYLPRLIGWAKATEISFRGNDLTAEESQEIGLLNDVVADGDLLAVAKDWAGEIAGNAPLAVSAMKRLFRHGLTEDFESHSHHVLLQTMALFRTKDFRESVDAFMERRDPRFEGR
jgi:enoyl-CoA hydratase/carnithine racemase